MKYDVVTIGTITRDVFLESELFRVFNDPKHLKKIGFPTGEAQCFALGAKVEIDAPVFTVGGGAANSAVTFARQGLRTAMIGKVGNDAHGLHVMNVLRKEKVHPIALYDKKNGTGYSVILLSPSGERTVLSYRGASSDIGVGEIRPSLLRGKWLYVVPGNIPYSVVYTAVICARKNGMQIAMNPSRGYLRMWYKKLKPVFDALDVVFLNREEAAYLTGRNYSEEKNIFRRLDAMINGIAVMTDGPRGVAVSDGTRLYHAGIYREKKVADRTGAGDAFGSGFVAALAKGGDIKDAIRFGSANATSVVEHVGAQEGILTKRKFAREQRWKKLPVRVTKIR